jgi:hypothetical protein
MQRYWESDVWAVANIKCEDPKHGGIRFHCMLVQHMTPTAAIIQDVELMEGSLGFRLLLEGGPSSSSSLASPAKQG